MTIEDYLRKIREILSSTKDYDSQRPIIEQYILFLEKLIQEDPSNIKAICQLSIAYYEDRQDTDVCIELMEGALDKYETSMSEKLLCELLNNLAYFYEEECGESVKAIEILQRVTQYELCNPKSYYALAYQVVEENPKLALEVIQKLFLSEIQVNYYLYLKGYVLMKNEMLYEALSVFEELSLNTNNCETSEKALYSSAIIHTLLNNRDQALSIADSLFNGYKLDHNEEVLTFELIHLYFLLNEFDRVVEIFKLEKEQIYMDVKVMSIYLFALKSIGLESECEKLYLSKIEDFKEEISDTESDNDFSCEEKKLYISRLHKNIGEIKMQYEKIVLGNKVVRIEDVYYSCKGFKRCYLVDCPRHS